MSGRKQIDAKDIGFTLCPDEKTLKALERLKEQAALSALNAKTIILKG